jgi:hypothetical protein
MLSLPKRIFFVIPALAFLAGCVSNPYKRNYTGTLSEHLPKSEPNGFVAATGEPQLLSSSDIRQDGLRLLEQGYFPIGRAKFREQLIDGRLALEQAREVGADVVLVKQQHVGSETYSVPVPEWTPDRTIVVNESAQTHDQATNNVQTFDKQTVTVIEGEYQTRYQNETVEYYDHTAIFWKKTVDPVFGVCVSELDDAQRKGIQSNKGVAVKAVVKRSPAFMADLFRGDILRRFAGKDVLGAEEFFDLVSANAGKTVDLELWRDGQSLKKKVVLRSR